MTFRGALLPVFVLAACPAGGDETSGGGTGGETSSSGETSAETATSGLPTTGGSSSGEATSTGPGEPGTGTSTDTTASTSGETTSGSSGAGECLLDSDCPPTPDECTLAVCVAEACSTAPAEAGTPVIDQVEGDCMQTQCDGQGGTIDAIDDDDVPAVAETCKVGVCTDGAPGSGQAPIGSACDAGVCDGGGACVECLVDADCGGEDACIDKSCVEAVNGCTIYNSEDLIFYDEIEIVTNGLEYSPRCVRVFAGTTIVFKSNFVNHPLIGGEVVDGVAVPDPDSPFWPVTSSGTVAEFVVPAIDVYPFYCTAHALQGMKGAIFTE